MSTFDVVERLTGDATTDFGVPGIQPSADDDPVSSRELARVGKILRACWSAFDAQGLSADGVEMRRGPRGGGRDLAKIRAHVLEAEQAYLAKIGGSTTRGAGQAELRSAYLEAISARVRGELPDIGFRGGSRWTPRYAVRRAAWHVLDHTWEVQDRLSPA